MHCFLDQYEFGYAHHDHSQKQALFPTTIICIGWVFKVSQSEMLHLLLAPIFSQIDIYLFQDYKSKALEDNFFLAGFVLILLLSELK